MVFLFALIGAAFAVGLVFLWDIKRGIEKGNEQREKYRPRHERTDYRD